MLCSGRKRKGTKKWCCRERRRWISAILLGSSPMGGVAVARLLVMVMMVEPPEKRKTKARAMKMMMVAVREHGRDVREVGESKTMEGVVASTVGFVAAAHEVAVAEKEEPKSRIRHRSRRRVHRGCRVVIRSLGRWGPVGCLSCLRLSWLAGP